MLKVGQPSPIIHNTTLADAPGLVELMQVGLRSEWNEAFVAWKYFDNPAGRVYGRCAELEGRTVAIYGNIPLRLKVAGKTFTAAQAVDAVVAKELRRHGLFITLSRQTSQEMDEAGVVLTYALPNSVSQAGVLGPLAWSSVGSIPRYVKLLDRDAVSKTTGRTGPSRWLSDAILRAASLASAVRTREPRDEGIRVEEVSAFDERVDHLWEKAAAEFPIAVVRDCTYLNWRYVQNPLGSYTILAAMRLDQLVGFAVLGWRDMQSRGAVAIVEFLVEPGDAQAGRALLQDITARGRQAKASQLQCWMLRHHAFYRRLLEQSGFLYWPSRFVPGLLRYTTPFVIRERPYNALPCNPQVLGNWYVTMGDHDYY